MKGFLQKHAPPWIKRPLRRLRRFTRRSRLLAERYVGGDTLSRERMVRDLGALGVRPGDTLMVHSSLGSLGYVDGGADAVVDALLESVGRDGTLVMPSFTFRSVMKEHLESAPRFDSRTSPSYMGKITEVFRLRAGVLRSLHPTHSVCALGPKAEALTTGHESCRTPFAAGSPFAKLVTYHAKIMCLGVPISFMTSFHTFEDWTADYPLPVYLDGTYSVPVTDARGGAAMVSTRCHNPALSAVRIEKRPALLEKIEGCFFEMGILQRRVIGKAMCSLIGAWELNEAMAALLARGITIYDVDLDERGSPHQ